MGRPVRFDNGTLIGVVSADVTLDTIMANVLGIEVLDSGYAYLLESDGDLIAHPELVTEGQTLNEAEFAGASSSEIAAFTTLLPTMLSAESGQDTFQKRGEEWYVTYSKVNVTGFVLAIVVPTAEVVGPATNILNLVLGQTFLLTILLGAMLAGVAVGVAGEAICKVSVPPAKLDSELASVTAQNLILVGGPCANTAAAEVMGVPSTIPACLEGFEEGKAMVKLYDTGAGKTAMLVAGMSALDTRRATRVVANFDDYALSGDEVEVTGTTLTDISVSVVG